MSPRSHPTLSNHLHLHVHTTSLSRKGTSFQRSHLSLYSRSFFLEHSIHQRRASLSKSPCYQSKRSEAVVSFAFSRYRYPTPTSPQRVKSSLLIHHHHLPSRNGRVSVVNRTFYPTSTLSFLIHSFLFLPRFLVSLFLLLFQLGLCPKLSLEVQHLVVDRHCCC
jgi:hypothetical protein